MRFYESSEFLYKNRLPQRSYYIPKNDGAYKLLNGDWKFKYFEFDDGYNGNIENWDIVS